jgi:hypothetical protein
MEVEDDRTVFLSERVLEVEIAPVDDNCEMVDVADVVDVDTIPDGVLVGAVDVVDVTEIDEYPTPAVIEMYSSRRFPAPQYSKLLPGQRKLQSAWFVAETLPGLKVLPQ